MESEKIHKEKIIRILQTSCYFRLCESGEARNLASVIGEDELSSIDKKYLEFGKAFEERYIGCGGRKTRSMIETLDLGWNY